MTEQDKTRLSGFSRCVAIILLFVKIILIIVIPFLIIAMIALPIVIKDVKIAPNEINYKNTSLIKISEDRTSFDVIYENDVIHTEENAQAIIALFDRFNENDKENMVKYVDCQLGIVLVSVIVSITILSKTRKLFKNIHNEDTPFIEDNVELLRKIVLLMIINIVLPLIMSIILSLVLKINVGITINFGNILELLIIICLIYIFKYGTILQSKSKEKIYE